MPALTPRQIRIQKDERAKNLLNGVKPRAVDQGDDDEAWQWIYEGGSDHEESEEEEIAATPSKKRKRKSVKAVGKGKTIVGARRADFEVRVGDTVMVRNENGGDWAAIVTVFFEDENNEWEKSAEMMCMLPFCGWFEEQIGGLIFGVGFIDQSEVTKKGKRMDFMAVSLDAIPTNYVVEEILTQISMNCISRLDRTPIRSIRLMAMPQFCPRRPSSRNTPKEFRGSTTILKILSCVAEVSI